jgi:hypothetical protein
VLDEADAFVESQIRAYEREEIREKCLSFQMRSELEKHRDNNNFPRIRFVFSGYRATHTNEGAWANWGDVLRLSPLSVDDATRLIEGPLARMGIDASQQAPAIAWRCGYQPAVLVRFGRQLLEHLESSRSRIEREAVEVSQEDVAITFNHAAVQEEIRTVVWNNFQGNRPAKVVFAALLIEFAAWPAGEEVDDAAARILSRLKAIDPDISWLQTDDVSAEAEIARFIREFVERELLVEKGSRVRPSYTLRFTHHLPVLKPGEQEGTIRKELQALRTVRTADAGAGTKSALAKRDLDGIRYTLSDKSEPRTRACIVASLWPAAIENKTGGVADRLGVAGHHCAKAGEVASGAAVLDNLVVSMATTPALAEKILKRRPKHLAPAILLGGPDLLRWAYRRQIEPEDELFEISSVGRLSAALVDWWFRQVRGIEFSAAASLEKIINATSGQPLMLAFLDAFWADKTGATLDGNEVQQALDALKNEVKAIAGRLKNGPDSLKLEPREYDILKMAAAAARDQPEVDLHETLTDLWEFYRDKLNVEPVTEADAMSVRFLEDLGLLPVNPNVPPGQPIRRLGRITNDDSLVALMEAGSTA